MAEKEPTGWAGLENIAAYYANRLRQYGETARGVDWNEAGSQQLRFEQLAKVVDEISNVTLNDLGCGYGAMAAWLGARYPGMSYLGVDISEDMICAATRRYKNNPGVRFIRSAEPDRVADYGVASGIFNVRLGCSDTDWLRHLEATLDTLDRTSRFGFAFNCLTSYSDREKRRPDLYYANPSALFDWCKSRYSRNVALLHDYDLYEFTILVKKSRWLRKS